MKKAATIFAILILAVSLAMDFSAQAADQNIGVQKWQYYEKIAEDKIWTVSKSDHEKTWGKSYLKEMDKGVGELIKMSEAGDQKASRLVKKMLVAGVPSVIKHYCLRPATAQDYKKWLLGYVNRGGKIQNFHDYLMRDCDLENMWVAKKDFHLAPITGNKSLVIIIPRSNKFLGGELGHNVLLFMDGYRTNPDPAWMVGTYTDTGFE